MRLIAVGDNVVDCYLDEGIYYPGGNAVNVAVGCKRSGGESAYLGIFGNDEEADHIKWALTQENISYEGSRVVDAFSGHPGVSLTAEGDRVFVGGPKDTAQHIVRIRLTPKDLDHISGFDICHTSCYSSIEYELPTLQKVCDVSFDFSSEHTQEEYLSLVCPYIRFAFFSGSDLNKEQIEALIARVHQLGVEVVGITLGSDGALFSQKKNGETKRFHQGIKPAKVIDTMGAGDSFIAGFLTHYFDHKHMEDALDFAATCAAKTCEENGG
ncbi:MAG: carbohydrate kinase, partial [Clostridiales bacterium]|nr:carbohydrate kinase [Clostridiales bacterium]